MKRYVKDRYELKQWLDEGKRPKTSNGAECYMDGNFEYWYRDQSNNTARLQKGWNLSDWYIEVPGEKRKLTDRDEIIDFILAKEEELGTTVFIVAGGDENLAWQQLSSTINLYVNVKWTYRKNGAWVKPQEFEVEEKDKRIAELEAEVAAPILTGINRLADQLADERSKVERLREDMRYIECLDVNPVTSSISVIERLHMASRRARRAIAETEPKEEQCNE